MLRRLIRLDSAVKAAMCWAIGRAVVLALMQPESEAFGDVGYYFNSVHSLFAGTPAANVLVEYPTPVVWLLCVPYALSQGHWPVFFVVFVALLLALDAAILALVWRTARRAGVDPTPACWTWIAFVPLMGPITYLRLDLLTAACTVVAVAALGRPLAGAMAGAGAAIKLWPAVLWPATMVDRRQAVRSSVAFAATGGVLAAASWAWAGWDRLVSPLGWQADRGLQVESVWATPAMLARLGAPESYPIGISRYQAFEITGPITESLVAASSGGTVAGGLVLVALYVLWLRRTERTPAQAGLLMIAATLIMIVANKTLSPQYLIWLGGPLAAALALAPRASAPARLLGRTAGWTLALAAATQAIYPLLYYHVIGYLDGPLVVVSNVLLAARNAGLAALTVWLVASVVRQGRTTGSRRPDRG